ncbi:MAG: SDR family oxidoreductase [Giesbergeria sp.]|jgi:short-subunit dehydrogenase|nr:SDR family oxidoreductase [Giesbergeria sp.]
MRLKAARVVLTGASGALGAALAVRLAGAGAALLLTARDASRLAALALPAEAEVQRLAVDLTDAAGVRRLAEAAQAFGASVLINNAGVEGFGLFETQDWARVEQILATNLAAPMQLTQALLPTLRSQPEGVVVNIGSAFGSIPFAGFAAYSAAKAGLRAFSQALRRELADSALRVVHVSPRAIDTPFNSAAVQRLNRQLGNASDPVERVADVVLQALQDGAAETHVGFPEKLFARLNGLAPELVDRALQSRLPVIKQHACAPATNPLS